MPQVTIYPGGHAVETDDGLVEWTFKATVDGRAGIVRILLPDHPSEADAMDRARELLEESPDQLEGIV